MIIVDEDEWLVLVTQGDHARLAGELLALWRADGLPDHPRREELLFATREHDNGWREADAAPWLDAAHHRPFDFLTYPDDERRQVWERGIHRYADARPLVALLIARHAEALYSPFDEAWRDFFLRLEPERQQWLESSGVDPGLVDRDYAWLRLADSLSLALCTGRTEPFVIEGVDARIDGDRLHLDPFPLAGTTTFRLPYRRIPRRRYDSDRDIGGALARARWVQKEVRVAPGSAVDA